MLSYDSFRTSKKDGRKAYQENGNLIAFPDFFGDRQELLPDTAETALIQVIRNLNPMVIVDDCVIITLNWEILIKSRFAGRYPISLTRERIA